MTVIFLLDDNKGMLFNHRRLSRDEKILEDIGASLNGNLFINKFSEKLISSAGIRYTLFDHFPVEGKDEADYFIENFSVKEHLNEIDRIIVYWWNRKYPSDYQLDLDVYKRQVSTVCSGLRIEANGLTVPMNLPPV